MYSLLRVMCVLWRNSRMGFVWKIFCLQMISVCYDIFSPTRVPVIYSEIISKVLFYKLIHLLNTSKCMMVYILTLVYHSLISTMTRQPNTTKTRLLNTTKTRQPNTNKTWPLELPSPDHYNYHDSATNHYQFQINT